MFDGLSEWVVDVLEIVKRPLNTNTCSKSSLGRSAIVASGTQQNCLSPDEHLSTRCSVILVAPIITMKEINIKYLSTYQISIPRLNPPVNSNASGSKSNHQIYITHWMQHTYPSS